MTTATTGKATLLRYCDVRVGDQLPDSREQGLHTVIEVKPWTYGRGMTELRLSDGSRRMAQHSSPIAVWRS